MHGKSTIEADTTVPEAVKARERIRVKQELVLDIAPGDTPSKSAWRRSTGWFMPGGSSCRTQKLMPPLFAFVRCRWRASSTWSFGRRADMCNSCITASQIFLATSRCKQYRMSDGWIRPSISDVRVVRP